MRHCRRRSRSLPCLTSCFGKILVRYFGFVFRYLCASMQDADLSPSSRWSCSPKLGGECTISYDLGAVYDLAQLRLGELRPPKKRRSRLLRIRVGFVSPFSIFQAFSKMRAFQALTIFGRLGPAVCSKHLNKEVDALSSWWAIFIDSKAKWRFFFCFAGVTFVRFLHLSPRRLVARVYAV